MFMSSKKFNGVPNLQRINFAFELDSTHDFLEQGKEALARGDVKSASRNAVLAVALDSNFNLGYSSQCSDLVNSVADAYVQKGLKHLELNHLTNSIDSYRCASYLLSKLGVSEAPESVFDFANSLFDSYVKRIEWMNSDNLSVAAKQEVELAIDFANNSGFDFSDKLDALLN